MRPFVLLAFAIACLCVTSPVSAQSCPSVGDGVCDEPGYGTGRCGANTDAADCSIEVAKRIGVLATSAASGDSALLWTTGSIADAQMLAMAECGADCELRATLTFAGCLAYARSKGDGAWGWSFAPALQDAEAGAVSWCQEFEGQSCRVLRSECGG